MASSGPLPSTAEGDSPAGDIPESREVDVPRVESMTRLREETAQFLRRLGVPAFADRSIVWKYGRIMPLIWMLSLQLGVVTASDVISGNALIVSAPIVAFVAFLAGPMSANALAIDTSRQRWLLLPLAVLPIFVFFVIRDTIAPLKLDDSQWLVPHFWCDAAVMLVALYAATIFLLPQAQASSRGGLIVLWITLLFMAATTILFSAAAPIVWTVGEVQEHTSFLPLLAMTAVLTVALALPAQSTDQRYLALSYALTVPLAAMVLTAGLINGLLIYFAGSAAATALSTAIALIVVAAAVT
jgi:hypothetical protein